MTIFLGCGFAAKYREGGGNFSVPLQWMLGLRRLKLDAIWLELLPGTKDPGADRARIDNFQRQLRAHGLAGRYCLLYQNPESDAHDLIRHALHRNVETRFARSTGGTKRVAQSRLFNPSAVASAVRAPDFL